MTKNFIQKIEENIVSAIIGLFFTGVIGVTGFYYSTTAVLAQQSKDIDEVKQDVKKIDNTPTINSWKINQVETTITDQVKDLKELSNEFSTFKDQYSKDREEMFRLLYEIKRRQ